MLRSRPLQTCFTRLAWLAVLLLLCAPLLSRALQAPTTGGFAEMCTAQGLKRVALDAMAPMSSSTDAQALAAHAGGDGHASHDGPACDYCVLAVRLLPLLLFLLALLPSSRTVRPPLVRRAPTLESLAWPAHAARGPPLYA
ncbi:MAG TPA: DUF2946 family protein [Stenotrophomonas sp.]|nr:DUF2946 family protein [Stenotrophomonas sp.]